MGCSLIRHQVRQMLPTCVQLFSRIRAKCMLDTLFSNSRVFKLSVCMYIWGFREHQHLRSLAPVMNDNWWQWWPNDIRGPWGSKASRHLPYRRGKTPKKPNQGNLSRRGMEPGPAAWQARMLPPGRRRWTSQFLILRLSLAIDSFASSLGFIRKHKFINAVILSNGSKSDYHPRCPRFDSRQYSKKYFWEYRAVMPKVVSLETMT